MTRETISAALYNLQAQINEMMGLIKDLAKQPTSRESATNLVNYSIKLAQLEGAFITLQEHAPGIVQLASQYPIPPIAAEEEAEEEEPEPTVVTPEMSKTMARVQQVHEDTAAALAEGEE